MAMSRLLIPAALGLAMSTTTAWGAEPTTEQTHSHRDGLHFSHPLITESPSPDNKVRVDYVFRNLTEDEEESHTLQLGGEYAFAEWLSVEAEVPYTFLEREGGTDPDRLGNTSVALKYANFALAESGLLLGGGLELGLPTGNEEKGIGSDHEVEIAPVLDFGYKRGRFEAVGFLELGIPANRNGEDEADHEIGWDLSFLYHLHPRVAALLEVGGEEFFDGEREDFASVGIAPGIKVQPFKDLPSFKVGVSTRFPLTDDRERGFQTLVSVFYHF